jgi:hypothetical protein
VLEEMLMHMNAGINIKCIPLEKQMVTYDQPDFMPSRAERSLLASFVKRNQAEEQHGNRDVASIFDVEPPPAAVTYDHPFPQHEVTINVSVPQSSILWSKVGPTVCGEAIP